MMSFKFHSALKPIGETSHVAAVILPPLGQSTKREMASGTILR